MKVKIQSKKIFLIWLVKIVINLIKNEYIKLGTIKFSIPFIIFLSIPIIQKYFIKSISNDSLFLIIPFIGIILVILFSPVISNELEEGTFRFYLTKPISRKKIFLSKLFTSYTYSLLITSYTLIIYCIIQNIISLHIIVKFYLYTLPIYFLLSLTIFLSIFIKNTPINSSICILLSIFSPILSETLFKNNITFIQYLI